MKKLTKAEFFSEINKVTALIIDAGLEYEAQENDDLILDYFNELGFNEFYFNRELLSKFTYKVKFLLYEATYEKQCPFNGGEYLGSGRNRRVFKHNNFVVKIPRNEDGYSDNMMEYYRYSKNKNLRKNKSGIQFARCRLMQQNCWLVMEYVIPLSYKESLERNIEWVGYIDCGQVGLAKDGHVVAYDYSSI
jgi:hypothetical protein